MLSLIISLGLVLGENLPGHRFDLFFYDLIVCTQQEVSSCGRGGQSLTRSHEAGVTNAHEPPDVGAGNNSGPLEEGSVLSCGAISPAPDLNFVNARQRMHPEVLSMYESTHVTLPFLSVSEIMNLSPKTDTRNYFAFENERLVVTMQTTIWKAKSRDT